MTRSSAEDLLAKKISFFLSKDEKEEVPRSCDTVTFQNQKETWVLQIHWSFKCEKNYRNTYELELCATLLKLQKYFEEMYGLHPQIIDLFYFLLTFYFCYNLVQK